MDKIEVINKDYMKLWYHPDSKIVHHKMIKTLPKGAHQELLSTGADYMEKYRGGKWLSDDTEMVAVREEDSQWADVNWFPRVRKAGWKYWAIVLPKSSIGNLQVNRFVKQHRDMGIEVEVFETPESAMTWLESK